MVLSGFERLLVVAELCHTDHISTHRHNQSLPSPYARKIRQRDERNQCEEGIVMTMEEVAVAFPWTTSHMSEQNDRNRAQMLESTGEPERYRIQMHDPPAEARLACAILPDETLEVEDETHSHETYLIGPTLLQIGLVPLHSQANVRPIVTYHWRGNLADAYERHVIEEAAGCCVEIGKPMSLESLQQNWRVDFSKKTEFEDDEVWGREAATALATAVAEQVCDM